MIYKKLGNTGISIPVIAQGSSGMGSYGHVDARVLEERVAALTYGIHHGLNFIDTAEMYGGGLSEETIGKTIAGMRDKVILASKFNPRDDVESALERSIKGSLARLKTEYLDLYQIHWPNPAIPIDRVVEALHALVERGLVRSVGVSNFSSRDFEAAQSFFKGTIVSNQLEYNLLERSIEETFFSFAAMHSETVLAYSPLNQGRVFGSEEQGSVLESLAKKYEKTISQVVLRWLISRDSVVAVSKMKNVNRVKENIAAMEFDLEPGDIARLDNAPRMKIVPVHAAEIRLSAPSHRVLYKTVDEAMEDRSDLFPSPMTLATMIKKGDYVKPIRLTPTNDASSGYRYDIDQYDAMGQVQKYWGWVIAHGKDAMIPAFVFPRANKTGAK